jgi:hypothetical protein
MKFEGTGDIDSTVSAKRKASESIQQPPTISKRKKKTKRKVQEIVETSDDTHTPVALAKSKGSVKPKESGQMKAVPIPKDVSLGMKNLMTSFLKVASPKTPSNKVKSLPSRSQTT